MTEALGDGMCQTCGCKLSTDGHCPRCKNRKLPKYPATLAGSITREMESGKWDTRGRHYRLLERCLDDHVSRMVSVTLTEVDAELGEKCGRERNEKSKAKGRTNRRIDTKRDDLEINVHGALGEVAAEKAFGVPYSLSVDTFTGRGDICYGTMDCKTVRRESDHLIMKPSDIQGRPVVLVRQLNRMEYRLMGWGWPERLIVDHELRKTSIVDPGSYWIRADELQRNWFELMREAARNV